MKLFQYKMKLANYNKPDKIRFSDATKMGGGLTPCHYLLPTRSREENNHFSDVSRKRSITK